MTAPLSSRLAALLLFAVVPVLALSQLEPPATVAADAPAGEFSAARAMQHVGQVARAPHPVGSVEHAAVRDYIMAELTRLGVTPELQRATVSQHETRAQLGLCEVENIVARLPGTGGSRRARLLVAHYDSVPTGPGASDDGHALVRQRRARVRRHETSRCPRERPHDTPPPGPVVGLTRGDAVRARRTVAWFDLSLGLAHRDGWCGSFEHDTDLFDLDPVARFVREPERLLAAGAAAPDRPSARFVRFVRFARFVRPALAGTPGAARYG